jgi:hypothetical protein
MFDYFHHFPHRKLSNVLPTPNAPKGIANGKMEALRALPEYRFGSIIDFWRYVIKHLPTVREGVYYEVYRQTHLDCGERIYNRYFTTLEAFVNGHNQIYYQHEVTYDQAGYSFIEEFLENLTEDLLHQILFHE